MAQLGSASHVGAALHLPEAAAAEAGKASQVSRRLQSSLLPSKNTFVHFQVFTPDEAPPRRSRSTSPSSRMQAMLFSTDSSPSPATGLGSGREEAEESPDNELPRARLLRELPPGVTTLMVRNIPSRFNVVTLLHEWHDEESFDFLLLPYSIQKQRCCGFAFINFVSPGAALDFQARRHGTYLRPRQGKHLDVASAVVQGYDMNTLQLRRSSRLTARPVLELLPILVRNQVRLTPEEVLEELGLPPRSVKSFGSGARRAADGPLN